MNRAVTELAVGVTLTAFGLGFFSLGVDMSLTVFYYRHVSIVGRRKYLSKHLLNKHVVNINELITSKKVTVY